MTVPVCVLVCVLDQDDVRVVVGGAVTVPVTVPVPVPVAVPL